MDSENHPHTDHAGEEEPDQFIQDDEVLAEIPDNEDHPMDERYDEADDTVGEVPPSSADQEQIVFEDNSLQHFPAHNGSVFTVSAHPTEPIAASGGEDDLGYIWDIVEGEVIGKLTGHSDSVVSTAFSSDGEMVATGGMDGKARVWRRVGKENFRTWEFLTEVAGPDEIMVCDANCNLLTSYSVDFFVKWLRWHPRGNALLAGSNDSTVWLWQCK
jgi:ribosome assembly protein SQT1